MGCWPFPTGKRAYRNRLGARIVIKDNAARNLESNSTTWVAYRVHGLVNSVSNIIVKHRHGPVTDCHRLPIIPMVPQSAPMVSVADASVKLYLPHYDLRRVQV